MSMRNFEHLSVATLNEAMRQAGKKVRFVAGGTDLLGILKDRVHPDYPERLVDLKRIPGLAGIREDAAGLHVGALTTLAELAGSGPVRERYRLLAEAARSVGSPQIRNMGTVGGNLCQEPRCWYYRAPDNRFHCLRKGGEQCSAVLGENRFHSLFGAGQVGQAPCTAACPGNAGIPDYLDAIRGGELARAARILLERNPMPAVTGRVCPHFCELACSRQAVDEAVSVRAVERQLGDYLLENPGAFFKKPKQQSRKKVAVVGAGPAGLTAAFYLRQAGHQVTVFDRMPEAGGMLTYSIPAYRLPKQIVRRLVRAYAKTGIEFRLGVEIGGAGNTLAQLRRSFDAVFLASGNWGQKRLRLENDRHLRSGLDFLTDIQLGRAQAPEGRVLVIGGGNVAVDVAISARRLGAREVTMACLEARDGMPAFPDDLEQALREGVKLLPSWGPHRIELDDGRVAGLELVRCTSVFDPSGAFRPSFDPSSRMRVPADHILVAIGQQGDAAYAGKRLLDARGLVRVDPRTQATALPGVYAGGDLATGPSSVVEALAAGRRAARAIDSFLQGRPVPEAEPAARAGLQEINVQALAGSSGVAIPELPVGQRTLTAEDTATIDGGSSQREAFRCVRCGCVAVNASDLAAALVALGAVVKTSSRRIPAEEFFAAAPLGTTVLSPGELVTEIVVPRPPQDCLQSYSKFRIRNAIDFPIVSVAAVLAVEGISEGATVREARVVLGAVAPVPLRALQVEAFLRGRTLSEETAAAAGEIAVRGVYPLAHNGYKVQVIKGLLRKALFSLAQQTGRLSSIPPAGA
jgi:NADPH-dependent glutamate synthase beta subunit-like oxidoreductase/CO/xanthine dehydrogenase FAD-binding subunit